MILWVPDISLFQLDDERESSFKRVEVKVSSSWIDGEWDEEGSEDSQLWLDLESGLTFESNSTLKTHLTEEGCVDSNNYLGGFLRMILADSNLD